MRVKGEFFFWKYEKADSTIFQNFLQKILKGVHLVDEEIASKFCLLYAKILQAQTKIAMKEMVVNPHITKQWELWIFFK